MLTQKDIDGFTNVMNFIDHSQKFKEIRQHYNDMIHKYDLTKHLTIMEIPDFIDLDNFDEKNICFYYSHSDPCDRSLDEYEFFINMDWFITDNWKEDIDKIMAPYIEKRKVEKAKENAQKMEREERQRLQRFEKFQALKEEFEKNNQTGE